VAPDATSLHVVERPAPEPLGDDPLPVLLVHGSMDRSPSFGRVQAGLAHTPTIAYDRRGYGRSVGRTPTTSFDAQVDDLLEVIGERAVVAFGHSFGGVVVLGAARRRPDLVRAALVWEPPMPWLAWWPADTAGSMAATSTDDPGDVADAFMRRQVGDRIWDRLPAATRLGRRAEGPALVAEMRSVRAAVPVDVTGIGVPVVVGAGGLSRPHQQRGAHELAAALPAGELVVIADAGHGAHLSHESEVVELIGVTVRRAGGPVGTAAPTAAESGGHPDQEEPS
jgi:pimeloyl-ACP methyl ester carboxylesterase